MTEHRSRPKRPRDANQLAKFIVDVATGQKPDFPSDSKPDKDSEAVILGRKGGLKGGAARAARLSPDERRSIAQRAAMARWKRDGSD